MKITLIAGARPNFMKIAPIIKAIENAKTRGFNLEYRLVHTGQHFDKKMSDSFFEQLNIPQPHINLGVHGGGSTWQTATIMIKFETELIENPTDLVLVVGDVNSTMACSLVAKKMNIKVAHVEGGIRSGDLTMPEEINRIVTDSISDYFFTTTELANKNLIKSGIHKSNIFFVGNTMIDTLLEYRSSFIKPTFWDNLNLQRDSYILLTMHRPANVDEKLKLKSFLNEIINNAANFKIIFPVHPRTKKILDELNFDSEKIFFCEPLGYLEFNYLAENAKVVITDSGGITEETTVMGVPCITIRDTTERPETITIGTNELIGTNPKNIKPVLDKLFQGNWKKGGVLPLWDGKTSERIIDIICKDFYSGN
jgi:UDP-N-acetylglucosamine 2-epimerase (non-hydrolysing)